MNTIPASTTDTLNTASTLVELTFVEDSTLEFVGGGAITNVI